MTGINIPSMVATSMPRTRTARPITWGDVDAPTTVERMVSVSPFRTLADVLREWSDDQLRGLLRLRPDLATPVPQDIAALASRAGTRASLSRAVERLDRFLLGV